MADGRVMEASYECGRLVLVCSGVCAGLVLSGVVMPLHTHLCGSMVLCNMGSICSHAAIGSTICCPCGSICFDGRAKPSCRAREGLNPPLFLFLG